MSTTDLSRRAMLAGAAALAPSTAFAIPAFDPDTELLSLGARLKEVQQERNTLTALVAAGANVDDARGYAFCTRLDALARDIFSRKAQSIAGLAVQTRAITLAAADLWEGNLPQDESHERAFIEAVCAFVGADVPTQEGSAS